MLPEIDCRAADKKSISKNSQKASFGLVITKQKPSNKHKKRPRKANFTQGSFLLVKSLV
jgi:hypothetical protein